MSVNHGISIPELVAVPTESFMFNALVCESAVCVLIIKRTELAD